MIEFSAKCSKACRDYQDDHKEGRIIHQYPTSLDTFNVFISVIASALFWGSGTMDRNGSREIRFPILGLRQLPSP